MEESQDKKDMGKLSYKEKTTSIKQALKEFRLELEGYIWSGEDDDYVYSGKPLAGKEVIDSLIGLLSPFSFDANLITVKDEQTFIDQQRSVCKQANRILHINQYSIAQNYPQIFQMFDDRLQNIADIILGSKNFMKSVISPDEEKERTF